MTDPRRALPSVRALLESEGVRALLASAPRTVVADAVRAAVESARRDPAAAPQGEAEWGHAVRSAVADRERRSLRAAMNATGVVLHTNLGRAPLPRAALDAMVAVAEGYSNLEYDLERGERGSRYVHAVSLLRELTGAEDALIVNNGAAALVLALDTLAHGREAIVSRGELIEIGGSFRVPDIMLKSGARLVEVGTTNRTHAEDYARAIGEQTGAVVKVHRSNFAIDGFVAEVSVRELAALARDPGVPVIHDLGSGLLIPLDAYGLRGEPVAGESVRDGAAVVTMSGDKLLGGPQAGIALGSADVIGRMRKNPLTRALRVDKLTLAALEATLALFRDRDRAVRDIPTLAMLCAPAAAIRARAERAAEALAAAGIAADVVPSEGSVGGGAFPIARLASFALALHGHAEQGEVLLRACALPVIGRITNGRLQLDLRSVPERDDSRLVEAVIAALG
ncbi:MAG: L-seryl-tRNA(Sec) selenium transferase [Gemmatimonadaceae bacterium]